MTAHLRYHQHVRGSLTKIEANFEKQVGLVEKYLEEVSHLKMRVGMGYISLDGSHVYWLNLCEKHKKDLESL